MIIFLSFCQEFCLSLNPLERVHCNNFFYLEIKLINYDIFYFKKKLQKYFFKHFRLIKKCS